MDPKAPSYFLMKQFPLITVPECNAVSLPRTLSLDLSTITAMDSSCSSNSKSGLWEESISLYNDESVSF